jgi:hypothetical protein
VDRTSQNCGKQLESPTLSGGSLPISVSLCLIPGSNVDNFLHFSILKTNTYATFPHIHIIHTSFLPKCEFSTSSQTQKNVDNVENLKKEGPVIHNYTLKKSVIRKLSPFFVDNYVYNFSNHHPGVLIPNYQKLPTEFSTHFAYDFSQCL